MARAHRGMEGRPPRGAAGLPAAPGQPGLPGAAPRHRRTGSRSRRRQTLQFNTFAQVPLLNPSRLVASWREILPRVRDAESRRIPLDATGPGVYWWRP